MLIDKPPSTRVVSFDVVRVKSYAHNSKFPIVGKIGRVVMEQRGLLLVQFEMRNDELGLATTTLPLLPTEVEYVS